MHRKNQWILGMLAWLGAACPALAGGPGTTGADVLKVNFGARPVALGGAYSAVGQDAGILLYNPAGLSTVQGTDLVFQHYFALEEVSYELFGYAQPLEGGGVFGSTLLWRHLPSIDNPGAPDDPVLANDAVIAAGTSRKLASFLPDLPPALAALNVGVAGKILYSSLREAHAWSAALDAGLYWSSQAWLPLPVAAAAAVQNVGTPLKFLEAGDPLPVRARLAAAVEPLSGARQRGLITAEWIFSPDQAVKTCVGAEYVFADLLSLRCGYTLEPQENLSGPAAGVGLKFRTGVFQGRLDYAYHPQFWSGWDSLANNHVLSLGASF